MTVKQLAQRLGADVRQLEFEFEAECKNCRKTGGSGDPCGGKCLAAVSVEVKKK
jgi:hypothetical protein